MDPEGATEVRSRVGSGNVFFCASRATCSTLMSNSLMVQSSYSRHRDENDLSQIARAQREPKRRRTRV